MVTLILLISTQMNVLVEEVPIPDEDEVEEEEELEGEMEMICHNLQRSTALARIGNTFKRPERNGDNRLTSSRVFAQVVGDCNFNTFSSLNNLVAHLTTLQMM